MLWVGDDSEGWVHMIHTHTYDCVFGLCVHVSSVCVSLVLFVFVCVCASSFDVRYGNGCQDCQCPSHYASGLSGLSTWGWLKQKSTLLEEDSSVRIVANATMNTYNVSLYLSHLSLTLSP